MLQEKLIELLDSLKLSHTDTVFFYEDKKKWSSILSIDTAKKLDKIKPTAFYTFNSQPFILFFNLTGLLYDKQLEDDIHKKAWSFDQAPIIFIIKDSDIEIYNAFSYEKRKNKEGKLQKVNVSIDERNKQFSFWNLQSGNTWSWVNTNFYKNKIKQKRVSQKLFDNIKSVREKLTDTQNSAILTDDEANTLILRLVFIRYLIDRDVKLSEEYIQGDTINERRVSFIDLISKPRLLNRFFSELNNKFNGVLFKYIKFELSKEQATALATVFAGETAEKGTLFYGSEFFFEVFDFSIIPVELISGIYESLIDPETRKLHSAVYTPSFLVEHMLTETVDEYFKKKGNSRKTECKVFDPAVGSGIFLVQSFRRMVEREIRKEEKISKVRLREIAVNNLFGIDINEQALKVACFSIYIAMLDYIDPKSILVNFHFPNLIDNNLFEADFFDTSHPYNDKIFSERVDFILGNPPWKSDKSEYHLNWLKENNEVTGRYEIAQSFLSRVKGFMNPNTVSTLIVTSTIFYNVSPTTKGFKNKFLTNYCVNSFFDLSPVRRLVFEEKDNPCAIVSFQLSDGKTHLSKIIKHQSLKSNIFLKYFKTLVIEKFDQKKILQKYFLENDWMFKVALYGNTLDFGLLKKIEQNKVTILNLIDNETLFKGAGIERGAKGKHYSNLEGLPIIENREITPYYSIINLNKKLKKEQTYLSRGRKVEIFEGNKILFKEQNEEESDPLISFVEQTCVFRKGVSSVATTSRVDELKIIYSCIISELYIYFLFIKSCSWGVSTRPQIRLDEEYLSFPFVEPDQVTTNKLLELVNAFLKPYQDRSEGFALGELQKNEINLAIEELYNIKGYEKDLINYVLDVSRYQFQESKQNKIIRKVHDDQKVLSKYAEVFIKEFESVYDGEFLRIDIYPLNYFIAINFVFQKNEPLKKINVIDDVTDESEIFKILSTNLSITKKTNDLYIQKDIKGFEDNSFYIIKPNEYKCWHRAMAWYDVAEIKEAIESAEIDYLKKERNAS